MRFDTPVFFQRIEPGEYDAATGNYGEDTVAEEKRHADVNDTDTETLQVIYGEIRQGSLIIRLQNHYSKPFDRIRVDRRVYRVDYSRKFRTKHVFVVSEVP